jgi:hypothetical protein
LSESYQIIVVYKGGEGSNPTGAVSLFQGWDKSGVEALKPYYSILSRV